MFLTLVSHLSSFGVFGLVLGMVALGAVVPARLDAAIRTCRPCPTVPPSPNWVEIDRIDSSRAQPGQDVFVRTDGYQCQDTIRRYWHVRGIRFGDVIVALNGQSIAGVSDLFRRISSITPGVTATLDVWRASAEEADFLQTLRRLGYGGNAQVMFLLGKVYATGSDRITASHRGSVVVVVSHVTPIKAFVRLALDAPAHALFRMELSPASATTVHWWPGGAASLRSFNVLAHDAPGPGDDA